MKRYIIFCLTCTMLSAAAVQGQIEIQPVPQRNTLRKEAFVMDKTATVAYSPDAVKGARVLKKELDQRFRANLRIEESRNPIATGAQISLVWADGMDPGEYALLISKTGAVCRASSEVGMYYGVQYLSQLFYQGKGGMAVSCGEVNYNPRYSHKDQSRNFDALYKKFGDIDGYTTGHITSAMIKMLGAAFADEFGIESIKVVAGPAGSKALMYEAQGLAALDGYDLLAEVRDTKEYVAIYSKDLPRSRGNVKSGIMIIIYDGSKASALNVRGQMDIQKITRLSGLNVGGLDKLKHIGDDAKK